MSSACREHALDALLAGELSAADAERVRAHAEGCAACAHALAWLRLERGWMARRARRAPERPALRFSALEARLATARPPPRPAPEAAARRGRAASLGRRVLGVAAAAGFLFFGLGEVRPLASRPAPWGQEVLASGLLLACVDASGQAVAELEDRFGACLIATPALPAY